MSVIDCHCHAGRGDELTQPWNTSAPLGRYLRRARAAGITQTVVVPTFPRDSARGNRELAHLVSASGGRLIGFAWVNPRRDARRVERIVREAVGLGLRGLKIHGHQAMPTREVCEVARRYGLPLLLDVHSQVHAIEMLAREFPRLPIVVAHLGSFVDDWRAHQTVIDCLVRHRNLYADTSGVRRFDYLLEAIRRAGPEKLLFGSDGPWLHPRLELQKIRMIGLPAADERLVTGGNLRRLLASSADPGGLSSARRWRALTPSP